MTDLSLEIETNSNLVQIGDPIIAVDSLRLQLSFTVENFRTIICIGDKTFETLCLGVGLNPARYRKEPANLNLRTVSTAVKDEHWSIYRVWLHSSYGKFENYGELELPKQLEYINEQVRH